jgi:RND family efflux transporter MFP subunit
MYRVLIITTCIILGISVFSGCSKSEGSPSSKKTELAKLKSELKEIQGKISKLEKEIGTTDENSNSANGVYVNVKEIKSEIFKRFVEVQGVVESGKAATLSTKMPGPVTGLYVSRGSDVKKGDLLLEIDDGVLQKTMQELQSSLDFAITMYEKQKRLYDQKAGSEVQYLQAKNGKESMERRMESLKEQIKSSKIFAPFSGVVDDVIPKLGETVSPGFPVIKLTSMSDIKVTAEVSESYLSTLKSGNSVKIFFSELNKEVDAKISVVSKSISPTNRTFKVEINLPSIPAGLRPNQVCSVKINDITKENVILVPISIVQKDENGKEFVYVVDNKGTNDIRASRKYIKTGLTYNGIIEITDGLTVNEIVITEGSLDINDGQKIVIKGKS